MQPEANDSDLALALNRYLCQSVLPLLTNYSHYFHDAEHYAELLDATLQTTYRISKCATLTKVQREVLSDFLVAFTRLVLRAAFLVRPILYQSVKNLQMTSSIKFVLNFF